MNRFTLSRRQHPGTKRPARARPMLERLEDRTVLSSYTAANVADLIADINLANHDGGSNTITLVTGNTFTLTTADNATDGGNGLPVIAANDHLTILGNGNLTILGNGDTIQRSTASGTPTFRLFEVASGASLDLANVTLRGGLAYGPAAAGGAIYSSGSLTLEAGTVITGNQAIGNPGQWSSYDGWHWSYFPAGNAYGGGVYVAGGTASLINATLSVNSAQGGNAPAATPDGSPVKVSGGSAAGGGMFVAGGTVTLRNDTVTNNTAKGGTGSQGKFNGGSLGGDLYIDPAAIAYLDASTLKHTRQIYGSYTLIT